MSGLDLNFGNQPKANPIKSQQKQAQVQDTSLAKQLMFGTSDTQRVLATAAQEGNQLGASEQELEFLNDMTNLPDFDLAIKYGGEAVLNRGNYIRQVQQLRQDKAEGRTKGELLQDTAVGVGSMAVNTVGGVAALATSYTDWMLEGPREVFQDLTGIEMNGASAPLAQGMAWLNEKAEGLRSQKGQEQRQQYFLEQELDRQDRADAFAKQEEPSLFDQFVNEAEGVADTLSNLTNNPGMAFDVVTEAAGSLLPMTAAANAAAKASIIAKMGQTAGKEFLKTAAGKAALRTQAAKMIPAITALTEGGSAGLQVRQEILAMSPEELMESDQYQELLNSGMSETEAQAKLADIAARPAELSAATIGLVTGRISARFEAAPLASGSIREGVTTTLKEGAEEFLQEAGNQFSSNVGMNVAGFETGLLEDTGEAGATGLVGGVGLSAAMQAPGAAANTIAGAAKISADGAKVIGEKLLDYRDAQEDRSSASGSVAMTKVRDTITRDAEILARSEALQTTAQQTEEQNTSGPDLSKVAYDAAFVAKENVGGFVAAIPSLEAKVDQNGNLPRQAVIEEAERILGAKDISVTDKLPYALMALDEYDSIQSALSDENKAAIQSLKEGTPERQRFDHMAQAISELNSSNGIRKAQEIITKIPKEEVRTVFAEGFSDLTAGTMDTPAAQQTLKALEIMTRERPEILLEDGFDDVFEQIDPNSDDPRIKALLLNKSFTDMVKQAEAEKEKIFEEQDAAFEESGTESSKKHKNKMDVREEILNLSNQYNKMMSVYGHFHTIRDLIRSGQVEEAKIKMKDLRNFGLSQIAKSDAFNRAAQEDVVNLDEGGVTYKAYGPFKAFFEQKGVWFNRRAPQSVALARDVFVDTRTVVGAYNEFVRNYPELAEDGELVVPDEHTKIRTSNSAPIETDPVPTPPKESKLRSDALLKASESLVDEDRSEVGERIKDSTKRKRKPKKKPEQTTPQQTTEAEPVESEARVEAEPEPEAIAEDTATEVVEEIVEEPVTEESQEEPKSLSDLMPNLLTDGQETNRFLLSFQLSKNTSKLLTADNAIDAILETVPGLSQDQKKELGHVANDMIPGFQKALDQMAKTFVEKNTDGVNADWWKSLVEDSKNILGYENGLSLNFIEDSENGPRFNEKVVEAFTLSAVQWIIENGARTRRPLKSKEINKKLGRPEDARVSTTEIKAFKNGVMTQTMLDDIADKAMLFMGVRPKRSEAIRFTQGIYRSMAANMIQSMHKAGWIGFESLSVNGKDYYFFDPKKDDVEVKSLIDNLGKSQDLFEKGLLKEPTKFFHIGKAPERPADSVKRQGLNKTSRTEKDILTQLNTTPNGMVGPMYALKDAIGNEVLSLFAGKKNFDPKLTNKADAESMDSTNRSIEHALELIEKYREDVEAYANENNLDPEEVETFFEWSISSVGRLQQEGPITPQGNKVAREMMSATKSVLDLTNQDHVNAVWMAAAQALGMKVEKVANTDTIIQVEEVFAAEDGLKPAVDLLQELLKSGEQLQDPKKLYELFEAAASVKDEKGKKKYDVDISMKSLHAVMTVARMQLALGSNGKSPELTEFVTHLAFEADGKTDGPINAMINAGYGEFTKNDVKAMAKGGLIISGSQMTLNRYIQGDKEAVGNNTKHTGDKEDLYEVAAGIFRREMMRLYGNLPENGIAVLDLMNEFLKDFDFSRKQVEIDGEVQEVNDFTIGRGLVKNPLTVFLYGSGSKGIAQKMAKAISSEIHSMMSDIAKELDEGTISHWTEHARLKENPVALSALYQVFGKQNVDKLMGDLINSELSAGLVEILTKDINLTTAEPLADAIDEATGGLRAAMETVRLATQFQGIAFVDAYEKAIEKIKKETGKSQAMMSEQDYARAIEEASQVAPIYKNAFQEFHISAKEKQSDVRISTSLTRNLASDGTIPLPGPVGVKGQPYLVIGTGDGKMIMNILDLKAEEIARTLMVFDGVEIALDMIKPASEKINESVAKGWKEESVTGIVNEGFQKFLREYDPSKFGKTAQAMLKDLVIKTKVSDPVTGVTDNTFRSPREALDWTKTTLAKYALENRARKNAIFRMNLWIDHMAGAEGPYENQGEIVESNTPFDPDLIAVRLNELYAEEKAKLEAELEGDKVKPVVQEPTKGLMKLLKKEGLEVVGTNVIAANGADLIKAVTKMTGASKEQGDVYRKLITENDLLKDTTFYFGSPEELNAIRENKYGIVGHPVIQNGAMYPKAKVAFIANASPETVLHEAIHVATVGALEAYYEDKASASDEAKQAMTRLERLMGHFQKMKFVEETAQDRSARTLQAEIARHEGKPVRQMAEFLAWSLSNQNLIEVGKDTRIWATAQKVARDAIEKLKDLLGIKTRNGRDMFSQIRFNTEVLILDAKRNSRLESAVLDTETNGVFEQVYGVDDQLKTIETRFADRLRHAMDVVSENTDGSDARKEIEATRYGTKLKEEARKAAEVLESKGFEMNEREKAAFMSIHSGMMTGMDANPAARRRAYELYSHMVRNAKPGTLGVLVGQGGIRRDSEGNSDLLATFVALGLVHKGFQAEMSEMKGMKNIPEFERSIDGGLRWLANTIINLLTQSAISLKKTGPDLTSQLVGLSQALSEIHDVRRSAAENLLMRPQELADKFLAKGIKSVSETSTNYFQRQKEKAKSKVGKLTYGAAEMVTALGSKDASEKSAEGILRAMNDLDGFEFMRDTLTDLMGVTKTNESLLDLVNKVKAFVDGMRQDYRERIPEILDAKFTRKLKSEDQEAMFTGIAETDLVSLDQDLAMDILKDFSKLPAEIKKAEEVVDKLTGKRGFFIKKKAQVLADWMINRELNSKRLLSNAYAIAKLSGHGENDAVVESIDQLTTLYALDRLSQEHKDRLSDLANNEEEGLSFVIRYQSSTKGIGELDLAAEGDEREVSRLNAWKGYTMMSPRQGHNLVVLDDAKAEDHIRRGYVRVGDYKGSNFEGYRGKRGYYQSTIGARPTYRQGVAQTVHSTYFGVDPRTGRTSTGEMAGYVTGAKAEAINARLVDDGDGKANPEGMIPRLDENGKIVAFERTMDPKKREALHVEKNMTRMLGAWSGRLVEEREAHKFNDQLIDVLKAQYDQAVKNGDTGAFINVADPKIKDPVIRDAWKTMGAKMKESAARSFGQPDVLMIRKDLAKDALGFHQASIRDPWTGVSRWSPETQKHFVDTVRMFTGNTGYRYLVRGEEILQTAVSYAKTTIVIRSIVVVRDNILSNNIHLMSWGIGPVQLAKGMRNKFLETNQYLKNQERILELTAELAANIDDPRKSRRLNAELEVLEDANRKLSIRPLIEAGEFSTVSESLTEADLSLRDGKFGDFLEWATDRLPEPVQGVGKTFFITKDSALFQGLNRAVQYGDFVAKAVLYDHLMKEKGYTKEEALRVISEEFVNYNRLAGRDRDYLESTGMMWFWNYKIRIMKVLARMARERPASLVLWTGGIAPMLDIDSAASGSLVGALHKGSLDYAIGPEMGWDSLTMNPWMNLMN